MTRPSFTGPDLCRLTARDAIALVQRKEITPTELIEASETRIAQTSPSINAMVTNCTDRARDRVKDTTLGAPLHGLPIGIKDLTDVEGVRTTYGTPGLADNVPTASDPLVTRLESRGAVVVGKTNTPEMGAGANTFNPVFGATRNPWDTRMNAAGSSGGAAAGLAAGEVWLSQGSDLGGSLRTPASFCGIVGLRPSPGAAGGGGAGQIFNMMPTEGPMARNVADCALLLDAMTGRDPIWPLSRAEPATSYLSTCLAPAGAVRIGFAPEMGGVAPIEPEIVQILSAAMQKLEGEGMDVVSHTPDVTGLNDTFRCFRALGMWTSFKVAPAAITSQFKPSLQRNIAEGGKLGVDDIAAAIHTQSQLYMQMHTFFQTHDVLACPISGIGPLPVEIEYPPQVNGVESRDYLDWLSFAFLATVCSLPALSLPVGFTAEGLPVGIQLIGPHNGEARLLQIARAFEERLGMPDTPIDPVVRHTG